MVRRMQLSQMATAGSRVHTSETPPFVLPLLEVRNGLQLEKTLSKIVADIGFETLLYASFLSVEGADHELVVVATGLAELGERYDRILHSEVDPRVKTCLRDGVPFLWDAARTYAQNLHAFQREADHFGISSGIALPVGSAMGERAMLALNSSRERLPTAESLELAIGRTYMLATYFHDLFFHNLRQRVLYRSPSRHVSKRELEVLSLAARGQSSKGIGRELGISERTANYHIASVKQKFGVRSRSQAIAQAVQTGLIR